MTQSAYKAAGLGAELNSLTLVTGMEAALQKILRAWGGGLPPILRLLAVESAACSLEVHELSEAIRDEPAWFVGRARYRQASFECYYSDKLRLARELVQGVLPGHLSLQHLRFFTLLLGYCDDPERLARRLRQMPEEKRKAVLEEGRATLDAIASEQMFEVPPENQFAKWSGGEIAFVRRFCRSPAGSFFFRVWFPCYMHFGNSPQNLFALATAEPKPNLTALKQLVTIDKRVVRHPRLWEVLHCKSLPHKNRRLKQVGKAYESQPKRLSRKQVKERIAGLLKQFAVAFHVKLSSTQIRELFDLIARARSKSSAICIDGDLDDCSERYRKQVSRSSKHWNLEV